VTSVEPSDPELRSPSVWRRLLGRRNSETDALLARAREIGVRESDLQTLSDEQLSGSMLRLRTAASSGTPLETTTDEVFALVREAARRQTGLRPYDVQIAAGIVMAGGRLAEMSTGEGKTLAAVPVACLLALKGRVHVLTFNDYLAQRDAAWMGPVYEALGFSVGVVTESMSPSERRDAYAADITYLTAREAGFDHLRDGLAIDLDTLVQPALFAAIVDEADSILIDEARIPLVLAGRIDSETIDATELAALIGRLQPGEHYCVDREARSVELTELGLTTVEEALGSGDLYLANDPGLVAAVMNAVHAAALLERDVDYIVREGRIELVDALTGRVAEQRQWPDGLQAAIEAKEGVRVQPEGRVLNSITLQHFLAQYRQLSGMTATAASSCDELGHFYGLDVLPIPRNLPCVRVDHPDRVLPTREAKREAVIEEVIAANAKGQPVVVGTASVAESEQLAGSLRARGVSCKVLNARNDALEAAIIAEAGGLGAVTISTNMAGRGTDIRLGGADEETRDEVVARGGLHVIGTNRHESRRIDDQLRGRAGRQGDPGSSRFLASLEDELVERYAAMPLERWATDSPIVHREIDRAQRIIDGQNFEIRRTLFEYTSLIDGHRALIHGWRCALLQEQPDAAGEALCPWPPGWLADASPEHYDELARAQGREAVHQLEREICLHVIDRAWGDHLARLAELRIAVHLNRYAGRAPLDVFRREAADAFDALIESVEATAIRVFEEARIDADGLAWSRSGLETPSSTWTYMINDQLPKPAGMAGLAYNPALVLHLIFAAPFLMILSLIRRLTRSSGR
jgi:preprotein translocase subunit SecA